jgi:hypothetical protein
MNSQPTEEYQLLILMLNRTLAASDQHLNKVPYCKSLAWKKIKIQNSNYGFY